MGSQLAEVWLCLWELHCPCGGALLVGLSQRDWKGRNDWRPVTSGIVSDTSLVGSDSWIAPGQESNTAYKL